MNFNHKDTSLAHLVQHFDKAHYREVLQCCADKHTSEQTLMSIYDRYFKEPLKEDDPLSTGLGLSDLESIMQYKLCRGKWRPGLQQLVSSNNPTACKDATNVMDSCRALTRNGGNINIGPVKALIDQVTALKGVGPATASLILSMWGTAIPFYSDELVAFYAEDHEKKPKYTAKEYLALVEKNHSWMTEQKSSLSTNLQCTARDLEEMIWYWSKTRDTNISSDKANDTGKRINGNSGDESSRRSKRRRTSPSPSRVSSQESLGNLHSHSDAWIDCHCHFTPRLTQPEYEEKWHAMNEAKFLVPEPYIWTPEATLKYMDQAGIQMQLLSNIPKALGALKSSNEYGASLVNAHPTRFGLLAALPTDDTSAAIAEVKRMASRCDGYAVTCRYNGVYLSDSKLDPLWSLLNDKKATVFTHPDAYADPDLGRPSPLLEVAFETARTVVDMLYTGWFTKFPHITVIVSHCGGALPALSGRLLALGTEPWVPNPEKLTREQMKEQLASLYLDTAATGRASHLLPGIEMVGKEHLVYGSDSGVPCSTVETLEENRKDLLAFEGLTASEIQSIGKRCYELFPTAKERLDKSS